MAYLGEVPLFFGSGSLSFGQGAESGGGGSAPSTMPDRPGRMDFLCPFWGFWMFRALSGRTGLLGFPNLCFAAIFALR